MKRRYRLRSTAVVLAGMWLAAVPATGQTPAGTPKANTANTASTYTPARTPDGQPDIQGQWNGGASFEDASFPRPEVNSAPDGVNCTEEYRFKRAIGIAKSPCAAYVDLFVGVIDGRPNFGLGDPDTSPLRPRYGSLIDLPDNKLPWSPEGVAKRADIVKNMFNPPTLQYVDPIVRCHPTWRPGGQLFLQIPGYVVILLEENHVTRVIPLDGRPHIGPHIRLPQGDPRGRWEGNTLIVETTNFDGGGWWNNTGSTIQSDALRVIERFTIVDANTMDYVVTVDDPKYFTKPWSFRGNFRRAKKEQGMVTTELLEYACLEREGSNDGTTSLTNILDRPGRPVPPEVFLPR